MDRHEELLAELNFEARKTRRLLELVPEDKFDWRPHARSWPLLNLAQHVANIPSWVNRTLDTSEIDFANPLPRQQPVGDRESLLSLFDERLADALQRLGRSNDDEMDETFTMRTGEQIQFQLPKKVILRNIVLNHIVHHRGQLTVYLRLLDIPFPGMYGPSADEIETQ